MAHGGNPQAPGTGKFEAVYGSDVQAEILRRMSEGETLRHIMKTEGMPSRARVFQWLEEDAKFAAAYKRAQDMQADSLVDSILEIADEKTEDPASRRVRTDARKWLASKIAWRRYGDKVLNENTGPDGGPQVTEVRYSWSTPPKRPDDGA